MEGTNGLGNRIGSFSDGNQFNTTIHVNPDGLHELLLRQCEWWRFSARNEPYACHKG